MDGLTGILDAPRARGAFTLRVSMSPPWAVRIQDEAKLALVAVVRGEVFAMPDQGEPILLRPGDVAVMRGPDPYTLADQPDTSAQVVVQPGNRCTSPDGRDLADVMGLGTRSWGNDPDGPAVMLVGTYERTPAIGRALLGALPAMMVLRHDAWDTPLIGLLGAEIAQDTPGQEVILDRLLDLVLISALRAWLSHPGADRPRWYLADADPVVGPALRHIHHEPARPWTVQALAHAVGVSRATLARRFAELVGQPPMEFLTHWRLALAADLLQEPDVTLSAVARQVGYSSPFALSAAFKRVHGTSPRARKPAVPV
ncbi:AraC family transcriptional regulator [Jiangella gansuensis]|uniref:AraC family transcriptional regulator n=1 Tax=Jiangella gansuensis TaxID=281473 RepID=UPI0004791753|nr:AraC family transcriptional regulator [Jiangella gansuensis]